MNAPSQNPQKLNLGPDPIPVSDEELAVLAPELTKPAPVELDILAPENLDAYLAVLEAEAGDPNAPGFLERAGQAAGELVSNLATGVKMTGENLMASVGSSIVADGQGLKDSFRRQTALTVQAGAMFAGTFPVIGETVKSSFKEVGTKLSVGYKDTPENRRKVAAVRQARDRTLRDISNITEDALMIADYVVGGMDLQNAYAPEQREEMMKAAAGLAEVGDLAVSGGVAVGAKLGRTITAAGARNASRVATSVGADKVSDLIQNTTKYAGSLEARFYRAAAAAAGNKVPNFGALTEAGRKIVALQEERIAIDAMAEGLEKTNAAAVNATKMAEQKAIIENIQQDLAKRADEAALAANTRPVSQQVAGAAVQFAGEAATTAGRKTQAAVDWLRDRRVSALGESKEAAELGDEMMQRATGVSPGVVERTAGWVADLGENVSTAGKLMRTAESSTPYFQRLARETDGWTRFAAQQANRVEFVSRIGRGVAEATDGAFKGAAVGAVFGTLQGDAAEGAGEGFIGGFFGGGLRTIQLERSASAVRARQIGDIAEARSRRTGMQQRMFDEAPASVQLAAATFEATNPNLVIDFVRQKGAGGSYVVNPDGTGVATIDLDSKIPLVPLMSHEVTHHIARNPDIAADIRRRFFGDAATNSPGIFTEIKDGSVQFKADFAKFRDEYLQALRDAGKDTARYEANPELILHEVIAEAGISSLLAQNVSGEFAGIGALRRNARPLVPIIEQFARSPMVMDSGVLQRMLMATGAVFREDGQYAAGTGLFETEMSPEMRKAVRDVIKQYDLMNLSERAGQVQSFSEVETIYSEQELASNPELMDLVSSGFDVDIDPETGKRKFLTAREAKRREQEFIDDLLTALDASPDISPGRVRATVTKDGRTIYTGKYIPADVLETLQAKNKYNPRQLEMLAMVTDTLKTKPGSEAHFVYQPAMTRGSRLYKQRAVTNRVETPISILISRTGGVLINTISQEKVLRNLEFFARKGQLNPWAGDVRAARADLLRYIDNTVSGREGADGIGLEKRDALNALFGQLTQVQRERNPVLQGMSEAQGRKLGVVQSRRLDRINQMKILGSAFRADYGRVSENLRPEIVPIPERFTGTGEERKRQSTKVSDEKTPKFFNRFDIDEYTKGGAYFDIETGEDVTGKVYGSGVIDVTSGRPRLSTSDATGKMPESGRTIRTNLFKQSAGWSWVGEAPSNTTTLVSVEMGKDHLYTLNSQFDTPVEMARYEDKKSEPRLRPTTRGVLRVGEKVGEIEVRGRIHPVYDKITTATDAPGRGIINRGEDSLQFRPDANDETTRIAAEYVRKAFGREYEPHTVYDEAPEARLKQIADYFQNVAKHQPDAPEVLRSYRAMADETVEQYKAMLAAGIKPEPYNGKGEPYASSEEMMRDVRQNKHLYFLRTDNAFGQGTQDTTNPLLEKSGLKIGDFELLVNDVFRVVHDYFGHTQQGLQFGPRGEFNAWKSHSRMYSEDAQGAVAAETLAQNAWVNFGAHLRRADGSIPKKGEEGYVPPQERPFGEQKNFIVPQELMQFRPEQIDTPEFKRWFGDSKVVDEDGNPLVVYHGTGKDFTTFSISPDGGAYFTVDKEEAQSYASERTHSSYGERLSPKVVEAYLRIKNPFDPDKNSLPGVSFGPGTWDWIEPHLRKIREAGYDGVRVKETPDTPDKWKDWVVFDPTQIKSATDNVGTFDPENPDIQYRPDALGFFSQLEETLAAIPPKASRQQIEAALRDGVKEKGELKARPVKAEEMADVKDVTGTSFADWMKQNPDASLDQMRDFAKQGRIRIAETSMDEDSSGYQIKQDGEIVDGLRFDSQSEADVYVDDQIEFFKNEWTLNSDGLTDPNGEEMYTVELDRSTGQDVLVIKDSAGTPQYVANNEVAIRNWLRDALKEIMREETRRYEIVESEDGVQYREWVLDNDHDNYRETLLKLPGSGLSYHTYRGHFDEKLGRDAFAHLRTNERISSEKKTVHFIEEIQSDLHQKAREVGYKSLKDRRELVQLQKELTLLREQQNEMGPTSAFDEADKLQRWFGLSQKIQALEDQMTPLQRALQRGTDDAPFKKSWHELAFKYALKQAVDAGSDYLGWTTGKQQAQRYNLEGKVERISYFKLDNGNYELHAYAPQARGNHSWSEVPESKLAEIVGKEIANRIVAGEGDTGRAALKSLTGVQLTVGGEGMRGFYDRILPQFADKYLKKYGIKTEDIELPQPFSVNPQGPTKIHAVKITPQLREDIDTFGQTLYRPEPKKKSKSMTFNEVQDQTIMVKNKKTKKRVAVSIGERYADQAIHPEALPLRFQVNKNGKIKVNGDGEPKIVTEDYNFHDSPVVASLGLNAKVIDSLRTKLNVTTLSAIKAGYINKTFTTAEKDALKQIVNAYSDRAIADFSRYAGDKEVRGAAGWYTDIAKFFAGLIPEARDRTKFLEFLGGTSPNTSVEQNFLYALDLFNRWKSGDFDQLHAAYRGVVDNYEALAGEYADRVQQFLKSGKPKVKDGQPVYNWVFKPEMEAKFRDELRKALESDGIPAKEAKKYAARGFNEEMFWALFNIRAGVKLERAGEGGGKYGVHTERILQILDGVWRETTDAPKAPNFTENLAGLSTRATIDVWAARWLRRLGHDGLAAIWRILPMSEVGVANSDFFIGQEIFEETTKRINQQFAEVLGRTITPDDLQAIMWFAEKREWTRRGWNLSEDLGDFRQYTSTMAVNPDGTFTLQGVKFNSTSLNFLRSLSGVKIEDATLAGRERDLLKKMREARESQIAQAAKGGDLSPSVMARAEQKYLAAQAQRGQKISTRDYRE